MRVSAAEKAVAIVGVGALMPDASNAPKFWQNIREGRYSITDVVRERWDPSLYYDADPKAPDKTYSKIGGWVRDWEWDPLKWKMPIPPRVSQAMDPTQKWAVVTAREALNDYGYPGRPSKSGAHCGHFGQRHVRRHASLFGYQNPFSGNRRRACQCFQFRHLASAGAPGDHGADPRGRSAEDSSDHRRHDAWRTGQHNCRTHRRPL